MSDDLIKMLRDYPGFFGDTEALMNAAADRIAALEAALRWIKEMPLPAPPLDDPAHSMRTIAARALEGKPND